MVFEAIIYRCQLFIVLVGVFFSEDDEFPDSNKSERSWPLYRCHYIAFHYLLRRRRVRKVEIVSVCVSSMEIESRALLSKDPPPVHIRMNSAPGTDFSSKFCECIFIIIPPACVPLYHICSARAWASGGISSGLPFDACWTDKLYLAMTFARYVHRTRTQHPHIHASPISILSQTSRTFR